MQGEAQPRPASALKCAQCNGWNGRYPARDALSTCDNRNNLCEGAQFCVKIVDPIVKRRHYTTFKSDCLWVGVHPGCSSGSWLINNSSVKFPQDSLCLVFERDSRKTQGSM